MGAESKTEGNSSALPCPPSLVAPLIHTRPPAADNWVQSFTQKDFNALNVKEEACHPLARRQTHHNHLGSTGVSADGSDPGAAPRDRYSAPWDAWVAARAGSVLRTTRRMQPPALGGPGPLALLEAAEQFAQRKKTSLWFAVSLLVVSVFILITGLAATTRTDNVTVGGYYPGIILGFGSFLGIIGINLVENRRQMLVAAVIIISFGMVAALCCAIADGLFTAQHIEPRPLSTGRCQFYSSGIGYLNDVFQTEVTCHSSNGKCQLKVTSNTCYCCELYNCDNTELSPSYYEFVGVSSCQDVIRLYQLLWSSTAFNILGLFLGIITAAVLGTFKEDMVSLYFF
ncbi:transmembrane protein 255B [Tamandua tetradactyla]|uniref:transmembrane protein 255B n=1 Tax=Tamandua tetradactyla TaxID=48850 RepID=UPI00405401F4